jgi:hypothetical protein
LPAALRCGHGRARGDEDRSAEEPDAAVHPLGLRLLCAMEKASLYEGRGGKFPVTPASGRPVKVGPAAWEFYKA